MGEKGLVATVRASAAQEVAQFLERMIPTHWPVFESDEDAIAYVKSRADEGSLMHQVALAIHGKPDNESKFN